MFKEFTPQNDMIKRKVGEINVSGFWLSGSKRWDNLVSFHVGVCSFFFFAEDFGSLRAAFLAARDMQNGKRPEEFQPMVIAQSGKRNSWTVKPEYVQTGLVI